MNSFYKDLQDPWHFINKYRTTFYAMVILTMPAFFYVYFEARDGDYAAILPELPDFLKPGLLLLCGANIIHAYWTYHQKLKEIRQLPSLKEKLSALLQANVSKFIQLEVTTILAAIVYFLNGHIAYGIIYIVMLVFFAMSNPSIYTAISDLRLPKQEAQAMRQNEPFEA